MKITRSPSLKIQSELNKTAERIARALRSLSTGQRSPADDSAAFAMSTRIDAQVRGLSASIRNVNQAQSLLTTNESVLQSQLSAVQRIREIAVQASSSTISQSERESLNTELSQLTDELGRLASSAEEGSFSIQTGSEVDDSITLQLEALDTNELFRKTIGTGTFSSATTLSSGQGSPMVVDDFNGDGHLDLYRIVTGVGSISLGKGDGTFTDVSTFTIGASATRTEFADVNNDGLKDLVQADGGVKVYLSNGDGTFQSARLTNWGTSIVTDVGVGDFNKDGNLDVITSEGGAFTSTVSLLLGDGQGGFTSRITFGTSTYPYINSVADLNADGNLDFIQYNNQGSNMNVFLGNGNGTFAPSTLVATQTQPTESIARDINRDGIIDVVVSNDIGAAGTVGVLIGNGDGSFKSIVNYAIGTSAYWLDMADVNGDEIEDVVSTDINSNTLSILVGNGDGTFKSRVTVGGNTPSGGMLRDVNEDGVMDLLYADNSGSVTPKLALGQTQEVTALSNIRVDSAEAAVRLIQIADKTIERIQTEGSRLSALHGRLEHTTRFQQLLSENLQEARSSLVDVDVAEATADLVRNQILQQAQVAALSQSNVQLQVVLELLR